MPATVDLRRADDRFHTELAWLDSRHSFSFSGHWDPANTHHGVLLVHNDDVVAGGGGFPQHSHRDMEIVTWVLEGRLRHRDSLGTDDVVYPGLAQRMRAGRGIVHSEMNDSADDPVHFLQMWVPPDHDGLEAGYEQRDVNDLLTTGTLVPVAAGPGGAPDPAIAIATPGTTLWVGRLEPGYEVAVPVAPWVHLFVARGEITLDRSGELAAGDAARLTDAGPLAAHTGNEGAELVIWEMHATLGR